MRDEMIQEAVLDSIDAIEEAQLIAEYKVLTAMAETYMKSALIQESGCNVSFDGYSVYQESENKNEDSYSAGGDLKPAKGGPAVPQFTQMHDVGDKKWYQKLWDWICDMARLLKKKLQKLGAKMKSGWAKFKTITDVEANALRRCGCKIVAGQRGENNYDVQFPFSIDVGALDKQLDELIDVFQSLSSLYEKATTGNGELKGTSMLHGRLNKIATAVVKATRSAKAYYTATEFFDKRDDLDSKLSSIEKSVRTIKDLYKNNAINSDVAAIATKAAGIFTAINNAVTSAMDEGMQLIADCEHAVRIATGAKSAKQDAKNANKEQKALGDNRGLAEFP